MRAPGLWMDFVARQMRETPVEQVFLFQPCRGTPMLRFLLSLVAAYCCMQPAHAIHRVELDASFEGGGVDLFDAANIDARVVAHLPESDGGSVAVLVVTGGTCPAERECVGLARYDERGRDRRSGGAPPVSLAFSIVAAAAIDAQDRVVIVGSQHIAQGDYDMRVMRLLSDGSLDPSFANGDVQSIVLDNGGANADLAHAVAIDAQGRIVVVGETELADALDTDFAVVRLRANGTLDPTFGNDGEVGIPFDLRPDNRTDVASAVAVGADGRIVVAGTARDFDFGTMRLAIARLNEDGSYDVSWCNQDCEFNDYNHLGDGRRAIYIGAGEPSRDHILTDVAVGDGGEVVITGLTRFGGLFRGFVQRLAYDGEWNYETELDAGDALAPSNVEAVNLVNRGNPAADIIVSGTAGVSGQRTFFAQRLTYALAPVADWGGTDPDGSVIHFNGTGGFYDPGGSIGGSSTLDRRGRLLVAGAIEYPVAAGNHAGVVARITSSDQVFFDGFQD